MAAQADIALIGLAVMGQNLILNMNDHGFKVVAYNRTVEKVDKFLENEAKGTQVTGAHSLEEMVAKLKKPRKIMILVKAGPAVDAMVDQLVPLLEPGDIIIDGGNSEHQDTDRRVKAAEAQGMLFVGSGVSGGEEGARHGPSLMPGGNPAAWPHIRPIFQSICAKVEDGEPCCDWVGQGGSGHYVKMVHNGIEYGDMQLICEAYHLLKDCLGLDHPEMSAIFKEWNQGELDSFLIEISANILAFEAEDSEEAPKTEGSSSSPQPSKYLVERILDSAGQKGTGKWTAISALDSGVPVTLIGESVFARCLSSLKAERVRASQVLHGPSEEDKASAMAPFKATDESKAQFVEAIRQALYASKIVSYAQGFMLLRQAAKQYGWQLNYGGIALMWRGGCIIRSAFLANIKNAYDKNQDLECLLLHDFFRDAVQRCQVGWRKVVAAAVSCGIPTPAFSTALAFYDGYRSKRLPANLIQAQRDYFGAHTYETLDNPGVFVHTNWTGTGGKVSASTYEA